MFDKLPVELRIMIWKLAKPEPRIIDLSDRPQKHTMRPKLPALLCVNRESRREMKTFYKQLLDANYGAGSYFDYDRDILYVSSPYTLVRHPAEVRNVVIRYDIADTLMSFDPLARVWNLGIYSSLRNLYLIQYCNTRCRANQLVIWNYNNPSSQEFVAGVLAWSGQTELTLDIWSAHLQFDKKHGLGSMIVGD